MLKSVRAALVEFSITKGAVDHLCRRVRCFGLDGAAVIGVSVNGGADDRRRRLQRLDDHHWHPEQRAAGAVGLAAVRLYFGVVQAGGEIRRVDVDLKGPAVVVKQQEARAIDPVRRGVQL